MDATVDVSITAVEKQHMPAGYFSASLHMPDALFIETIMKLPVNSATSPFTAVENRKNKAGGELCKDHHLLFKVFTVGLG
jgi:hypothetical protein